MHADREEVRLRARLDGGLADLGLDVSDEGRKRLLAFVALLARWNRAYNLTAVRDPLRMVPRHLLDSLSISPFLRGSPILDLGSGAGLPGIPLAILHPGRRFVLLDSNGKKTRFLRQAVLELALDQVEIVQARMESYRPQEKFATIVSRAVTSLAELWAAAEPLLERRGRLLVMKGRFPGDELSDLATPAPSVQRLSVPFLDGERHLVEIRCDDTRDG
jgi:16S rRNA (guanine527-N7)-methyltransferase